MATKKNPGRPTKYTPLLADKICFHIASGESLLALCKRTGMPTTSTIYKWLNEYPEFSDKYRRAREEQADYYADDIISIADNCTADSAEVAKAKLRIDARKWYVTKVAPRKYADRVIQNIALHTTLATDVPKGLGDFYADQAETDAEPSAETILGDQSQE